MNTIETNNVSMRSNFRLFLSMDKSRNKEKEKTYVREREREENSNNANDESMDNMSHILILCNT